MYKPVQPKSSSIINIVLNSICSI